MVHHGGERRSGFGLLLAACSVVGLYFLAFLVVPPLVARSATEPGAAVIEVHPLVAPPDRTPHDASAAHRRLRIAWEDASLLGSSTELDAAARHAKRVVLAGDGSTALRRAVAAWEVYERWGDRWSRHALDRALDASSS